MSLPLVLDLFEAQVARSPAAIAVRQGAQRLAYGELNERANRLAHYLRRRGVGRDTRVGVGMRRTPALVIALLAVWKAGGAYVPLDPGYPEERLKFMLLDAGVKLLLTEKVTRKRFPFPERCTVCVDGHWPFMGAESGDDPRTIAQPSDLAYVMYTSGSTGKPKGAMIVHGGLLNYLRWAIDAYAVRAGDSVPVHSSISFDLTVTSLYTPLLAGGEVELLPEEEGIDALAEALRRQGGRALVKITPAHLDLLSLRLKPEEAAGRTRLFVIGGENLRAESLRFWREHAPDTRLVNEYGPTETVVGCCAHEVQPGDPDHGAVPIGRPIAGTRIYVLGDELCVAGAGVARGYLNRPELTAERFPPDPEVPGQRMYKTGDLARVRADGVLEYLGRRDQQVKVRGYRIELGEIEQTLAAHPDVRTCVVLAREDSPGERRLVGYVVARAGAHPGVGSLQQFLSERLPDFMLPTRIVTLSAFPLTTNGKVDRDALPPPSAEDALARRALDAPRSPTEAMLAALWCEILSVDRVGIHENVFDLGARSLAAVRATVAIRNVFGVDVALRNLFESPTVAQLAEIVNGLAWARSSGVPRAAGNDREELTL